MAQRETSWPAAASARATAALVGPPRAATVLAAFPSALYLRCHDGSVLPVVARDGLRLPSSVVLAATGPTGGWGLEPGDSVTVGRGEVRLPGGTVRAVRTWVPMRFRGVTTPGDEASVVAAGASDEWRAAALDVARTARRGGDVTRVVAAMVGRGPGLTPSGDDVLCGLLLGLQPFPLPRARVWAAVVPRLSATTSLSAALLTESVDGYAVPAVLRLGEALAAGPSTVVRPARPVRAELQVAVRDVARIGHSSGADLLAGLAAALDTQAVPAPAVNPLTTRSVPETEGVPA